MQEVDTLRLRTPFSGPVLGTIDSATGEIGTLVLSKPGEPYWDAIDEWVASQHGVQS